MLHFRSIQNQPTALQLVKTYEIKIQYLCVSESEYGKAPHVGTAQEAVAYMQGAFDERPEQESFWVICLNRKNRARARHMVTLGTQSNSLVHPREVFRPAILSNAMAIICVHNHPSGDPTPSAADISVTRQLREASKTVGIDLLDHLIIGEKADDPSGLGYYSFRASGLI
jgi:DNA repair protein RadC